MRLNRNVLVPVLLAAMWAGGAQAQTGGASAAEVQQLVGLLGSQNIIANVDRAIAAQFTRGMPCVAQATVAQTFDSPQVQQDQLNVVVSVYQRHFTSADVQQLLTFYRSPTGQKWLRENPAATREIEQTIRQHNQQRFQSMLADQKQRGVLDSQGRCPASQGKPVPAPTGH